VVQDGATAGGYPHALVANLAFGAWKNLQLGNASGVNFTAPGTPNNQVKITADFLSVFNATLGVSALLSSVSVTADVTVSGVNGLDTGSVAANTWYAVFVIYNPTTRTTAALLSTSATAPTLPSGYTYSTRLGWMRTDGSSHFLRALQVGRRAQYVAGSIALPIVFNGGNVGNPSTPTWVSSSISAFFPPTAAQTRSQGR
jgi:hypothetical protein